MPLDEWTPEEREAARKRLLQGAGLSAFPQDVTLDLVVNAAKQILQQRAGRYLLAETDREKQALFGEVAQEAVTLVLQCRRELESARESATD
jgi:hypothetical protein